MLEDSAGAGRFGASCLGAENWAPLDVAGFPFASVLRGIYDDADTPNGRTSYWAVKGR